MKPQMLDLHDEKNSVQKRKISHARTFAQIDFDVPGKAQAWQRARRQDSDSEGAASSSLRTTRRTRPANTKSTWAGERRSRCADRVKTDRAGTADVQRVLRGAEIVAEVEARVRH